MSETAFNAVTHDYAELPFDVEPHKEALRMFDLYGYDAASVIAALIARDLIYRRMPHGEFRINCAVDSGSSESATFNALHRTSDAKEARLVKYEVERYFMRHFPGRCLNKIDDAQERLPPVREVCRFCDHAPIGILDHIFCADQPGQFMISIDGWPASNSVILSMGRPLPV